MSVRMKLCVGDELAWSELAFLTVAVASINAWNRVATAYRFSPPIPQDGIQGRKKILYLPDFFRSCESEISVPSPRMVQLFFLRRSPEKGPVFRATIEPDS